MGISLRCLTTGSPEETLGRLNVPTLTTLWDLVDRSRNRATELGMPTGRAVKLFLPRLMIPLFQVSIPITPIDWDFGAPNLATSSISKSSTRACTTSPSWRDKELNTLPVFSIPTIAPGKASNSDWNSSTSSLAPQFRISSRDSS